FRSTGREVKIQPTVPNLLFFKVPSPRDFLILGTFGPYGPHFKRPDILPWGRRPVRGFGPGCFSVPIPQQPGLWGLLPTPEKIPGSGFRARGSPLFAPIVLQHA